MIGIYISNLFSIISNGISSLLNTNKIIAPNNFLISPWSDSNIASKTQQQSDNSWSMVFSAGGELKQSIPVSVTSYTVSLYVKNLPADATITIESISPVASILTQVIGGESSASFTRIDYPFTVTVGVTSVDFSISSATGGTIQIKNVQINSGALKTFSDITKYYVSSTGSDLNTGLSRISPWLTTSKIESLSEGNTVYFDRDGVYDEFTIPNSGTVDKKITISAYGTGAKPKFKKSVLASGWVDEGAGVQSYTNALLPASLLSVIFDGAIKGKGRIPKTDFYTIDSHIGDTSITSSSLTGTPDYTGSEVVIRKQRFIYHVSVIESQVTDTITYGSDLANPGQYNAVDGYGFFIQNHSSLITELGEWYYDGSLKKVFMYFGAEDPTLHTVELPLVENAIIIDQKQHINLVDICAEVTNSHGIDINDSDYIDMNRVEARFCFNDGVSLQNFNSSYITFRNGLIEECHTGGFYSSFLTHYVTVIDSTIRNIGLIIGAGGYYGNDDSRNQGITAQPSNGNIVSRNRVYNIGFNGISANGSGFLCQNNRVDNYCLTKDDGGGIYVSIGSSGYILTLPGVINGNICTNGIGYNNGAPAIDATEIPVHGIYLDDNQHNTSVTDNFSSKNVGAALYLHNTEDITVTGNIFSDNHIQIKISQDSGNSLTGTIVSNNVLSNLHYDQLLYEISSTAGNITLIGTFSNNEYYVVRGGFQYFSVYNGGTAPPSRDVDFVDFKTVIGTDSTSTLTEYQDVDDSITVDSTVFTQLYPNVGSITAFALGGFTFLDKIATSLVTDLDTNAAKLDISGVGNAFAYMRKDPTATTDFRRLKFSGKAPATEAIFLNFENSYGPRRSRYAKLDTARVEYSILFDDMVERIPNDVILWIFPDGFSSITIDNVVEEVVTLAFTPEIKNVYNNSEVEETTALGASYRDLITDEVTSSVTLSPGEFKSLILV